MVDGTARNSRFSSDHPDKSQPESRSDETLQKLLERARGARTFKLQHAALAPVGACKREDKVQLPFPSLDAKGMRV